MAAHIKGVLLKAIVLHILCCYLKKILYIDYLNRPMDKNRMEEDRYISHPMLS